MILFGKHVPFTAKPFSHVPADALAAQPDFMAYSPMPAPAQYSTYDGGKYEGGFGITQLFEADYWTLRQRSAQLFTENLFARGLIRRLVTNEINTGLTPEACPDEDVIGVPEDSLNEWTDEVESRFAVYAATPAMCDYNGESTFAEIQRTARREALVAGDILVVQTYNPQTKQNQTQLIAGDKVRNPLEGEPRAGNEIKHGVELSPSGKQVAYWVAQKDGTSKRLPAVGTKSGRRVAWLLYGTDKRMGEVRGQPILSLVLQSLKELDRYRDNVQRKAALNATLAMFIQKDADKPGTLPLQGGATRRGAVSSVDTQTGDVKEVRTWNMSPGTVFNELQQGETPQGFNSNGTDEKFGDFQEAILSAVAWANEIPPETLILSYGSNYAASQSAINEFRIYLNLIWSHFGETFCARIYQGWLINETLKRKISAPGLVESWRTKHDLEVYGAWVLCDWYGSIKPSSDMLKAVKASDLLVEGGYSTRARESRILAGTKFAKNVKRQLRENEALVKSRQPLADEAERQAKAGVTVNENTTAVMRDEIIQAIQDAGDHG